MFLRTMPEGWNLYKERDSITLQNRGMGYVFHKPEDNVITASSYAYNFLVDFIAQAQETAPDKIECDFSEERVESLFDLAGFEVKKIYKLENKYWPDSPKYDDVRVPWWLVKTSIGLIQIGWRKRVLSIDWSDTGIQALITDDDVTKDFHMVHAYSYAKALEYLTRLQRLAATPAIDAAMKGTDDE